MGLFSSSKSSTTQQSTTNNQYDQREVWDAGGGLIGNGSVLDQSIWYDTSDRSTSTTNFSDSSNRSSTTNFSDTSDHSVTTNFSDTSNRSTNFSDTSNRSVTTNFSDTSDHSTTNNISTIDAGTVALAQAAQQSAASTISAGLKDSYAFASSNSQQAYQSNRDALGFAETAFDKVTALAKDVVTQAGTQAAAAASTANTAYQSAADTSSGNKTLIYVGMAAVALVAAGIFFKR